MPADDELLALQRRFLSALREPIFGDSRARSELPPRAGATSAAFEETAVALLAPSASLAPVQRLELYHRQYWYRLLDSIAEDFPALRHLVGDVPFWRLIEAYFEAVPPGGFTLRHLGAALADFIAAHPDAVPLPVHGEELARLEYARCVALEAGEGVACPPALLAEAKLHLQPHVQLLALRTAADTLWRRADQDRPRGKVSRASERPGRFVAVYRDELVARVERLHPAAYTILATIDATGSLDAAMEAASAASTLLGCTPPEVAAWFQTWVERGWLCAAV